MAFNKKLGIVGATVTAVVFSPDRIVVGLRRRCCKVRCLCGWTTQAVHDCSVRPAGRSPPV
jgi:hypothetical protein